MVLDFWEILKENKVFLELGGEFLFDVLDDFEGRRVEWWVVEETGGEFLKTYLDAFPFEFCFFFICSLLLQESEVFVEKFLSFFDYLLL